jgi:hypothetical protein
MEFQDSAISLRSDFVFYVARWLNAKQDIQFTNIFHIYMALTTPVGVHITTVSTNPGDVKLALVVRKKLFEFYSVTCVEARTLHKKMFGYDFVLDECMCETMRKTTRPKTITIIRVSAAIDRVLKLRYPKVLS